MSLIRIRTIKQYHPLFLPTNPHYHDRYKIFYGGRYSAKSTQAAMGLLWRGYDKRENIICIREVQKNIRDSVKATLVEQIAVMGVSDFYRPLAENIYGVNGTSFGFFGLQEHVAKNIKSFQGATLAWLEEANTISDRSWEFLIPTIRKEGSEIWATFNPDVQTDPVWKMFIARVRKGAYVVKINWSDLPTEWLSSVILAEIAEMREYDEALYLHIYGGQCRTVSDRTLIPYEWAQAAINAHEKLGITPTGLRVAGLDVADEGADSNAIAVRKGIVLEHLEEWSGSDSDIFKTTQRTFGVCDDLHCTDLLYDADGLGSGVRGDARVINEQRAEIQYPFINVTAFRGSGSVTDPGHEAVEGRKNENLFANYKAQTWWSLRLRFQETYRAVVKGKKDYNPDDLISIPARGRAFEKLIEELTQPTWSPNGAGKILVNKKPDGAKSPNLADAVNIVYSPYDVSFNVTDDQAELLR